MISHSENVSAKLTKSNRKEYRYFTTTNMVRVYPAGLRVNSSNFNPLLHWASGAQLVALNYQTLNIPNATPMLINRALFSLNGGCGYVLKPAYLRTREKLPRSSWEHYRLRILSATLEGQNILETSCFSVSVNMYASGRKVEKWSTGKMKKCNDDEGRVELFWNRVFEFSNIKCPELTFFQFTLKSTSQGLIGLYMISAEAMQEGNVFKTFKNICFLKTVFLF